MLKEYARLIRQSAITIDIVTVVISYILAHYVRSLLRVIVPFGTEITFSDYTTIILLIPAVWWMILNAQGAYKSQRFTSLLTEYKLILKTTIYSTLTVGAIAFVFKLRFPPRSMLALFVIISFCLLTLEKRLFYYIIGKTREKGYNKKTVLIVGTGKLATEFAEATRKYSDWGLDLIGFLTDDTSEVGTKLYGTEVLGVYNDLMSILHERVVEEVIFALPTEDLHIVQKMLALCEQEGVQSRVVSNLFRTVIAKVRADEIHGIPVITFFTTPSQEWQLFIKRIIDVIVSSIALIVLSPIFAIIVLLIKLTSPGPLFYEWKVIGFNKKPLTGYKFRTMVVNADELKGKLLTLNEMSGPVFKIKNDPRITPIGRILRKFSLDELPQLWSVLKGDMSLVGPRPAFAHEVAQFENWQRRKFSVKPGLTCLWQVSGRSQIKNFDEWARLDLQYIDNWSLWLDFKILLKTIPVVVLGKGC